MAAKLNKKYFGNRNIGTGGDQTTGPLENSQNYSDDRIGGEGIASINWSTRGSWRTGPVVGLALPAPTLPGGVQATWTLRYSVASVVTSAGKTNLSVGWKGTNASIPGLEITVTDVSGANALFSVTTPATPLATIPFSGNGQSVTFTKSGGGGTAANFVTDVNWQVDASTVIVEKGSGYGGGETFTVTVGSGTTPAGTIVLTTDNGIPYSAGNQENALVPYAYVTGGGRKVADIIRQVGARRYKVRTADGVMTCSLKTTAASNAAGEMDLSAIDSSGKTYYVKKLTGHKATLVQYGSSGWEFASDTAVQWTLGAPVTGVSVKIDNA